MSEHITTPLLLFILGLVLFAIGAWSYQAAQDQSRGVIWTGGTIVGGLLMLKNVIPLVSGLVTQRSRGRCAAEDCSERATYEAEDPGRSEVPLCGLHCAEALMKQENGWARQRRSGLTLRSSDRARLAELRREGLNRLT